MFTMSAQSALVKRVIEAQLEDPEARLFLDDVLREAGLEGWRICSDQELRYQDRLFIPASYRDKVLTAFHSSTFAVHPGGTKMYQDLKRQYWWKEMKEDVARFVAKCLNCQQVKIEHVKT